MSIALLMGVSAWAQDPAAVSVYEDCSKNGKTYDVRPTTGTENGHTWVDLGLPSGLKWASYNIGATTPEGYGNYYAWGETTTKEDYSWATYKYANGAENKLTKYCYNASYGDNGFTDDKTTLEPEDDAAHVNWGDAWRMPTYAEWTELREQCTWTWTTQKGVDGYQVTSNTNSNSIFLPAAGYRYNADLRGAGSDGDYWYSSLYGYATYCAWSLSFGSDYKYNYNYYRSFGFSVRPVCPSSTNILTLHIAGCEKADTIRCDAGQQIIITAVPANEHHHFTQWSDGNTDNPRTVSVTKDSTFTAEFSQDPAAVSVYEDCSKSGKTYDVRPTTGAENGHTWVDLGLPSGLQWASCNVGATTPEEYGNYYAWGETTTKEDYSWTTYKYANGGLYKQTKYCNDASHGDNGFTDNLTTLEPADDAARVNWGGDWRMPTAAEWKELREQCTWTWTKQNGVKGYQVTGNTNSNSIFLPAAGYRDDTNLIGADSLGDYWSSSLRTDGSHRARELYFYSGSVRRYGTPRNYGQSVRPVCPSSTNILTLHIAGCEKADTIRCDAGQQITITAVPANEHHHFVRWSDGNTDNPRTISVEGDATYTAEFAIDQHTIAVTCDPLQGVVTGAGTYDYGTQVTLTATANAGYRFEQWSNGVTANPYLFTATEDLTLEAQFTRSTATAVNNIPADGDTTVRKVFRNGQVLILRGGKTYTTTGVEVK